LSRRDHPPGLPNQLTGPGRFFAVPQGRPGRARKVVLQLGRARGRPWFSGTPACRPRGPTAASAGCFDHAAPKPALVGLLSLFCRPRYRWRVFRRWNKHGTSVQAGPLLDRRVQGPRSKHGDVSTGLRAVPPSGPILFFSVSCRFGATGSRVCTGPTSQRLPITAPPKRGSGPGSAPGRPTASPRLLTCSAPSTLYGVGALRFCRVVDLRGETSFCAKRLVENRTQQVQPAAVRKLRRALTVFAGSLVCPLAHGRQSRPDRRLAVTRHRATARAAAPRNRPPRPVAAGVPRMPWRAYGAGDASGGVDVWDSSTCTDDIAGGAPVPIPGRAPSAAGFGVRGDMPGGHDWTNGRRPGQCRSADAGFVAEPPGPPRPRPLAVTG